MSDVDGSERKMPKWESEFKMGTTGLQKNVGEFKQEVKLWEDKSVDMIGYQTTGNVLGSRRSCSQNELCQIHI